MIVDQLIKLLEIDSTVSRQVKFLICPPLITNVISYIIELLFAVAQGKWFKWIFKY